MKHLAKKRTNPLLIVLLVVLFAGIGFSGYKLGSILLEYHKARVEYAAASDQFIVARDESDTVRESPAFNTPRPAADGEDPTEEPEEPAFLTADLTCPFTVGFERMWESNGDVVAWISSPGTVIDYPVLHGATNDTYLHHTWTGRYSVAGSIFTSYANKGDLSDFNTILYGHHMKDGSMFASIRKYSSQSYYENHPYIWYVTPEANYALYVVAAYIATISDAMYTFPTSEEEVRDLLDLACYYSNIEPTYVIGDLDAETILANAKRMVVMSTCTYEFDNARYVVVAVPLLVN